MPLMLETLEAGREVTFSPRGTSMLPMLCEGRDRVTLSKPSGALKKYDIALYQRRDGRYVLHRVVCVGETYTMIGDNQFIFEKGILEDQIIGVCTSFVRKGKKTDVTNKRYRLYVILWHYSRFPRRILYAIRSRLARLWKK